MSSLASEYWSIQRGCKSYKDVVRVDEGSNWGNCDFWKSLLSSWQSALIQYGCIEWHDSLTSENLPSTRLPCCCPMLLPGVWSCVFVCNCPLLLQWLCPYTLSLLLSTLLLCLPVWLTCHCSCSFVSACTCTCMLCFYLCLCPVLLPSVYVCGCVPFCLCYVL